MKRIADIKFKKLDRISPSQFHSMKSCIYRTLLAEALDRKPLLCASPSSFYGTVLHKMLELVSTGEIKTVEAFDEAFDLEIRKMESKLSEDGNAYLTPLAYRVKDFTLKKILVKRQLIDRLDQYKGRFTGKFISEKWLESNDGSVGGKIDLIIERDGEVEIVDFKTGKVLNKATGDGNNQIDQPKPEYVDQLKLYAHLYFEQNGQYPDKLSIVDLRKEKYELNFSQEECITIFEEAKMLLKGINESIESDIFSATPSKENCRYCGYRPACKFYLLSMYSADEICDLSGKISKVTAFPKGGFSLEIETDNGNLKVLDFPNKMFDEFNGNLGKSINIFNLRRTSMPTIFNTMRTTVVYEQPEKQ